MPDDTQHILLTQRFLPEHGGSIRWMYEVYRRWPTPVEVITHDYYRHPPRTPEFPRTPAPPEGRADHVTDSNLRMDRRDIFIRDWGLEDRHRAARYWRMNRAVNERLRKHRRVVVHAVHAVPEVASLVPLKWRYGNRLRVVCYAHGEEVTACRSSRQLTFLMHRAHGAIDLMLANSRYTAGVLRGHIDPRKVHVMNPGVDLAGFDGALDAGRRWRERQGYTDRLVVLTVGRLDPRKNHAAVIRAVAALKDRLPGAELRYIAAGEGRALPALKALAQQLNVADRVVFPGSVDGPTKLALYGACDVFAMPAIRDGTDVEGFGMVFLEAGACFKPSLAGQEGGQADAVLDGETGLIVDGTNQDAVTQALERLLSDKSLREKLGTRGRAYAETFDWPRVVQRTAELVEKI